MLTGFGALAMGALGFVNGILKSAVRNWKFVLPAIALFALVYYVVSSSSRRAGLESKAEIAGAAATNAKAAVKVEQKRAEATRQIGTVAAKARATSTKARDTAAAKARQDTVRVEAAAAKGDPMVSAGGPLDALFPGEAK